LRSIGTTVGLGYKQQRIAVVVNSTHVDRDRDSWFSIFPGVSKDAGWLLLSDARCWFDVAGSMVCAWPGFHLLGVMAM
jgi:hypothetical protein